MKKALLFATLLVPILAFGQATDTKTGTEAAKPIPPTIVSVKARATDVRAIIADLFTQAKRNYVLQPGIQAALFLNLDGVEFEEALNIICAQSKLQFQVQNGIYFISKKPVVAAEVPPAPAPKGTLDKNVLKHALTAKFAKTDLRLVIAAFAKQTDVDIEVEKSVPNYRLDATLSHTTLKLALDKVTEAAGLKYKFTDNMSILIYKPVDTNKVAVSGN
jgi:hypothetical protein